MASESRSACSSCAIRRFHFSSARCACTAISGSCAAAQACVLVPTASRVSVLPCPVLPQQALATLGRPLAYGPSRIIGSLAASRTVSRSWILRSRRSRSSSVGHPGASRSASAAACQRYWGLDHVPARLGLGDRRKYRLRFKCLKPCSSPANNMIHARGQMRCFPWFRYAVK